MPGILDSAGAEGSEKTGSVIGELTKAFNRFMGRFSLIDNDLRSDSRRLMMVTNVRLRISVVAVFVCDSEVLLLHQMTPPEPDLWDLPGGGLEPSEDLMSGLKREVLEEIGLTNFQVKRLLTVAEAFYLEEENQKLHKLDIIYECQATPKPTQFETSDDEEIGPNGIRWIAIPELTPDNCTSRTWKALTAAKLVTNEAGISQQNCTGN